MSMANVCSISSTGLRTTVSGVAVPYGNVVWSKWDAGDGNTEKGTDLCRLRCMVRWEQSGKRVRKKERFKIYMHDEGEVGFGK